MKNSNIELTAELFNLLTVIYDEQFEDCSKEDLIDLIRNAAESVGM